jgi:hypothetical protein
MPKSLAWSLQHRREVRSLYIYDRNGTVCMVLLNNARLTRLLFHGVQEYLPTNLLFHMQLVNQII